MQNEGVNANAVKTKTQFKLFDLWIRDEEKSLIRFKLNQPQREYLVKIAPDWERIGDLRGLGEIILKSRKQGFSTLILALFFLDTINNANTYTVVIAHDTESTQNLFEIVKTFYDNLPESTRPQTRYENRREYSWPSLNSRFFVGTAGSDDFGRGSTINNIHASEVASWRDGDKIAAGLFQAVPKGGNLFLESTAQGIGNFFHEEFEKAQRGESSYRAHFVPWFHSEKYATPAPANFQIERGQWETPKDGGELEYKESDEEKLRAAGVNDDQLQWRREKMREPGMRKKFKQEYPATAREAFISSGNPYFDLEKLDDLAEQLKGFEPIVVAVPAQYVNLARAPLVAGSYTAEDARQSLMVWEAPIAGEIYVIGADTAEGIDNRGDHDYNSGSVWRVSNSTEVARLHGRFDKHLFGLMLAELGFWYNTALLGIERNNTGGAVINAALYAAHYPEGASDNSRGLYMHQEYDEKRAPRERRAGYPTTRQSKFLILDELESAIQEGEFHPRSRELVADMQRFVKMKNGKVGAENGHDDRVIDAAIARRMLNLRPRHARRVAKKSRSSGFSTVR